MGYNKLVTNQFIVKLYHDWNIKFDSKLCKSKIMAINIYLYLNTPTNLLYLWYSRFVLILHSSLL